MKIADVLRISSPFGAKLVTGEENTNRKVHSIEVMEVPEVDSWVREGTLIITTFYAVRNNTSAQSDIIRTLINKQAAGIIVKIGRFIDQLPNDILQFAERENFPIILLPKKVPYIKILNPLYVALHKSKNIIDEKTVWKKFERKSFINLDDVLNNIANILNGSVYIEDIQGRLLYCSEEFIRDGWRRTEKLFSLPSEKNYKQKIAYWLKQLEQKSFLFLQIPGQKKRVIVPMIAHGKVIAIIHLIYGDIESIKGIDQELSEIIVNKIYVTMMREFVELQKKRLIQNELIDTRLKEQGDETSYIVLLFQTDFPFQTVHSTFIDYYSLYRKKIEFLIKDLDNVSNYLIFEKNKELYALLTLADKQVNSTLALKEILHNRLENSLIPETFIALSPVFYKIEEINRQINTTNKTIEIGKTIYEGERVYSYNKLGIYEFLIHLSAMENVTRYINDVLNPLYESEPVLLETLTVYLQENLNASRTAEKLFVNRRTITNRLQKIKDLLGIDLDDAESIFILHFCLLIKKIS